MNRASEMTTLYAICNDYSLELANAEDKAHFDKNLDAMYRVPGQVKGKAANFYSNIHGEFVYVVCTSDEDLAGRQLAGGYFH
jgi:hypothetical protein